jgi:hypothetical protein
MVRSGFSWTSIKDGVGVENKYQEFLKRKQLSIFWKFSLLTQYESLYEVV